MCLIHSELNVPDSFFVAGQAWTGRCKSQARKKSLFCGTRPSHKLCWDLYYSSSGWHGGEEKIWESCSSCTYILTAPTVNYRVTSLTMRWQWRCFVCPRPLPRSCPQRANLVEGANLDKNPAKTIKKEAKCIQMLSPAIVESLGLGLTESQIIYKCSTYIHQETLYSSHRPGLGWQTDRELCKPKMPKQSWNSKFLFATMQV